MEAPGLQDAIMARGPYDVEETAKLLLYREALTALTRHHAERCPEYRAVLAALDQAPGGEGVRSVVDLPYLPVRLFKEQELRSVPPECVVKTLTSSGTTGQQVSKIYLDKETAHRQSRALSRIMASYLGPRRLPMLVIDSPKTVSDRRTFSARAAGILGFARFGHHMTFALDDEMRLDRAAVEAFLARHADEPVFLFGFTFMVWRYLIQVLEEGGARLPLERGILFHGGGWKHLEELAVDADAFRRRIRAATGIERVHDYYGMVEQVGSIFVACERGHFHCSSYSHVLIRDPHTFEVVPPGRPGLVQLLSPVPGSYPGHSILSEDLGEVIGCDDCPCGRRGTYFRLQGRIRNAELRGCSNTHSAPKRRVAGDLSRRRVAPARAEAAASVRRPHM